MREDRITKALLILVVLFLAALIVQPIVRPGIARAQEGDAYPFYVEPGFTTLHKPDGTLTTFGKVVIDMRTGEIWGFPTQVQQPYPRDTTSTIPPKSHPMYLGQFVFSEAHK